MNEASYQIDTFPTILVAGFSKCLLPGAPIVGTISGFNGKFLD